MFCKIFLAFCEIQNYFVKILCFAKISQQLWKQNFAAILLLQNLPSATHPPLPSAWRFFNAVQQCYIEMKTNKEPCFSILPSVILWLETESVWAVEVVYPDSNHTYFTPTQDSLFNTMYPYQISVTTSSRQQKIREKINIWPLQWKVPRLVRYYST